MIFLLKEGSCRLLKSGPAMKHQRHFTSGEGTSWWRAREPSRKGGSGSPPRKFNISGRP